jgi:hypothetical protein
MRPWHFVVVLTSALLAGCFSARGPGSAEEERAADRISLEELESQPAGNVYDAVQRLRPIWLRNRGPFSTTRPQSYAEVFVDERYYGPLESLRQFDLTAVAEVRYLSGRDATTRFGTGYPGGIIQLILKKAG